MAGTIEAIVGANSPKTYTYEGFMQTFFPHRYDPETGDFKEYDPQKEILVESVRKNLEYLEQLRKMHRQTR